MKLEKFIQRLYDAGWKSPLDAQHTEIEKLWRELFPGAAELHDELEDLHEAHKELISLYDELKEEVEDSGVVEQPHVKVVAEKTLPA